MFKYRVKIGHTINYQSYEVIDKQRFSLFISPLIITAEPPIAPYIFDAGSYKTIALNRLPVVNVTSFEIIEHIYPYLDMVTLRFEDRQCHSKTNQYYVSFEKVI